MNSIEGESNTAARRDTKVTQTALWLVCLAMALLVATLLAHPLQRINTQLSPDYNEGWNAVFTERWEHGELLYPEAGTLLFNNYPPLSFVFTATVARLFGQADAIVAGRWISLCSLLVTALCIGLITFRSTRRSAAGVFSSLLFLTVMLYTAEDYVASSDPQMLAHALATAALAMLLWRERPSARRVAITAVLLLTAGFIKHNLLALPLAISIWLLFTDRRLLFTWLATSVLAAAAAMLLCYVQFGTAFFIAVLQHHRHYTLDRLVKYSAASLTPLIGLLSIPVAGWLAGDNRPRGALLLLYAAIACIVGVLICGGDGIDDNAFFDLMIAGSMATAIALDYLSSQVASSMRWRAELAMACVTLAPLAAALPMVGLDSIRGLHSFATEKEQWAVDIAFLARRGDAMCEYLSLCYWAGKAPAVDFFNTGEAMTTGHLDMSALLAPIEAHRFSVIQTAKPDGSSSLLPDAVNEAIRRNYAIAHVSPVSGAYLVPRPFRLPANAPIAQ